MTRRADRGAGTVFPWKRDGVQIGYVGKLDLGTVDGKRKRQAIYGKTPTEVRRKLNEALRDHQRGLLPTSGRLTVRAWLTDWLRSTEATVRPRTFEHYRWLADKHLTPALGKIHLVDLTRSKVEVALG